MIIRWFNNEEVRPVSFRLGPVGLGWQFIEGDKEVASQLLTYLEDRGVLFNRYARKCPSGVMESIDQIRERIQEDMQKLARDSFLFAVLDKMRTHIKVFRNYACLACDDDAPMLCKRCKVYETGCVEALDGLRAALGFEIAQFAEKYGLTVRGQLADKLPERM